MPIAPQRRGARHLAVASAAVLVAGLATSLGASADEPPAAARHASAASSCFWTGPFTPDQDKFNYAYLDAKALYWSTQYTIPEGSRLTLKGAYAHARYQSLNSYEATSAVPLTALNDQQIQPDKGSRNPYLPGAKRTFPKRSWTVDVEPKAPPKDPAQQQPNTLYAAQPGSNAQALIYRVYVPDRGRDMTGGVGLPEPVLTLADGKQLTGQALCDTVHPTNAMGPRVSPLNEYLARREQPGKPVTFPATSPVAWHASYTQQWSIDCVYHGKCTPAPPRGVGQYSNLDNAYVAAWINRGLGPVLVLKGKVPTTPRTYDGDKRMASAQLRYWSLCSYETWSTKVDGAQSCVYDQQLKPDRDGDFTVIVSRPGDRPRNARSECGVNWIAWPEKGDGAGHLDDALLLLRNMMPAKDFKQAPQFTRTGDDEANVMGPYLPKGAYTTKAGFEQQGCSEQGGHSHGKG
ncbi:hypothetical protein [Streptomyces sp. NPDC055400]